MACIQLYPLVVLLSENNNMKHKIWLCILLVSGFTLQQELQAQGFLKKLKEKVEKKAEDILDKRIADKTGSSVPGGNNTQTGNGPAVSSSKNGRPTNTTGEGLKNSSVPDVLQQIQEADAAYNKQQFGEARFSVQQALLSVELQIGKSLLLSLPTSNVDIAPTVLHLHNIPAPVTMTGRPFVELLKKNSSKLPIVKKSIIETSTAITGGIYKLKLDISEVRKYRYINFSKAERVMQVSNGK